MENHRTKKEQYYGDYLGLDKILDAQFPESEARGIDAHDELLFIIIHQSYELWFKQIMHELDSVLGIFQQEEINDNSSALLTATRRIERIVEIWKLLVSQVDVLETMTAMDFLDFRDLLTPASGFQSYQFRVLEAKLGLKMENRHQKYHYKTQLREEHIEVIKEKEKEVSLFQLLDDWLARIPFWNVEKYWKKFQIVGENPNHLHPFWASYRNIYQQGLKGRETLDITMQGFDSLFFGGENRRERLSPASCQAVLFVQLYRDYPLLQQPFRLLSGLLEIDELMANWRYRHMIMVRRMIGMRSGTGGSSGASYLQGALEKHHIFGDLAGLATYLVPRSKLPKLPRKLENRLRFYDI